MPVAPEEAGFGSRRRGAAARVDGEADEEAGAPGARRRGFARHPRAVVRVAVDDDAPRARAGHEGPDRRRPPRRRRRGGRAARRRRRGPRGRPRTPSIRGARERAWWPAAARSVVCAHAPIGRGLPVVRLVFLMICSGVTAPRGRDRDAAPADSRFSASPTAARRGRFHGGMARVRVLRLRRHRRRGHRRRPGGGTARCFGPPLVVGRLQLLGRFVGRRLDVRHRRRTGRRRRFGRRGRGRRLGGRRGRRRVAGCDGGRRRRRRQLGRWIAL